MRVDANLLVLQVAEWSVCTLKVEEESVSVECLIFIAALFVLTVNAVFSIADEWVADMGKVCADLMRAPRYQLDLDERLFVPFTKHLVPRDDLLQPLCRTVEDLHHVIVCIFHEIGRHRGALLT